MENSSKNGTQGCDLSDLQHKVALVTGASSGLGREFCLQLARSGCRVVAAARRTHLLQSLVADLESDPGHGAKDRISTVQMDVSVSEAAIDTVVAAAWQRFGRIDVLVNNAGFRGSIKSPLELDEDEWNKVMNTNLRGVWLVSKAVGKRMVKEKIGGSIINIATIAALERGLLPGAAAYAASKAGVNQLTKMMALELGNYNIRVNSIAPGLFLSEITAELLKQSWVHEIAPEMVPLQRNGIVHPDLTCLILLLASDCSFYITGNVFVVDGGQTIAGIRVRSSL